MVLGNEQKIIERCLRAAKPLITHWSISSNGKDSTRDIVLRELSGIPGQLHERPWKNFGHNRTEAIQLGRGFLSDSQCVPSESWFLLLDADHEIVSEGFDRESLSESGYLVRQTDTTLDYSNVRLIRADQDAKARGVTHEYWDVRRSDTPIAGLKIIDHNDGGSKADKFERDIRLLLAGLEDPADADLHARYKFYLAQSYQDSRDYEEAARWYRERRDTRGHFEEERWMAAYRLGRTLLYAGKELEGEAELLRAFQERPTRAEPLYHLAKHHREKGRNHLAELFAQKCVRIPYPKNDLLFVEREAYQTGPLEELAIASWHTGEKERGLEACEALLTSQKSDVGRRNLCWYAKAFEAERGRYEVSQELRTFEDVVYNCANPSVCGDVVNIRLVNYLQERGRRYWGHPDAGIIKTQNVIQRGDHQWSLDDSVLTGWNQDTRIFGLEDVRLVEWLGRHWFTATTCQVPGAGGSPQVVLGRLSEDLTRIEDLKPILFPGRRPVEKNWVLWPQGDQLFCVYSFDPLVVMKVLPDSGEAKEIRRGPVRGYAGQFRGSSPVIETPDGSLAVVHDVSNLHDRNVYTHRLVEIREGGLRVSRPFLLEHHGIEYACGLSFDGETLTISYGLEDREAKWMKLPRDDAHELLRS